MKWIYKLTLILITYNFNINSQTNIKVLLEECFQSNTWEFRSDQDFFIRIPNKKIKKKISNLEIDTFNGKIYINNKLCKYNTIQITPPSKSHLTVNNNPYHGSFIITRHNGKVLLINSVELEDYICSVLKTESWPGWPKEVNKVFAVASRSYVLAQAAKSRKKNLPYHIRNTNYHQTYSGMHDKINIKNAVLETKGLILGYNSEPILAMFDSCCGGIIPAHIDGFDFENHPYLARTEPCCFCKPFKIYSWKANYTNQDFKKVVQKALPHIRKIKKITTTTDKAGTVKKWVVHGHKKTHTLDARTVYSLFGEIKSFCYSIIYNHLDGIKMDGTGYGHHLGLCQWGAREMVNKGYKYRNILKFYYPGAKFMKVKN